MGDDMRRFWILFRSFLLIMLRDKGSLFGNLALPVGLLLLFGTISGNATIGTFTVAAWFMAGVTVQSIMSSGLGSDMAWLTSTRDRGILLRVRATPLPPAMLVGAYVSVRLLLVIAQAAAIVAVAVLVFDVQVTWRSLVPATGIVALGGVVFLLLGQAIAAAAPNANTANTLSNLVFFPLLFLSNLVVLTETFPQWLDNISRWNPAYMLVDLLRPTLIPIEANQAVWVNVAGLICYGLLGLFLAARFFRWEPKR